MRVRTRSTRLASPSLHLIAAALALAGLAFPALGNEAEVVSLAGKGEARETGSGDWRPAVVKQRLRGGAFVRTGDSSTMALLMSDQTQLRLNQNSMLQIKETAAGAPTRLELKGGRAWMNSKAKAGNVVIDTPNATAAIRGTEWELEVDPAGKTLLAVLSGTVELSNPQGSVTVGRNEGAVAEFGKAPVKVALVNPKDRVQWVNAYAVDPRRYTEAAKGTPAVRSALDAIAQGDFAGARRELAAEKARGTPKPAVYGLLADLDLVSGETNRALATLGEGLAANPRDPELLGQLATTQLVADKADEARKTVAQPRSAETAGILVAEGEVARRDGDVPKTFTAFTRATTAAPADDRGWFALGRAQNEREDTTPARASLAKAIELNPAGAGYQGELGTLETFANRFGEAQAAFEKALAANPADYVALTGLGLLRLKQGDAEGGLEALLRAGVLEPRYARARTYTAVAYYQLGRHADAIATFRESAALDDKDPLPYLFLTQVFTDLFRAGDAVDASREALKRLPNLKSLNQVANNQQGTANLGYSLAFFGLESWALEIAQQSYSPYLASSHLFLADRYPGDYNKNSELFKGFLSDPTAFGGSNRFSTLLSRTGQYGSIGGALYDSDARFSLPGVRLSGLANVLGRSAYFIEADRLNGTFSLDSLDDSLAPARVKGDVRTEFFALGLGNELTENLAFFGYGTRLRNNANVRDITGTLSSQDKDRGDIGLRYRFSPTSITWVKAGATREETLNDRFFSYNEDLDVPLPTTSGLKFRPRDIQARHSLDITDRDHFSFGYETARDERSSFATQAISGAQNGVTVSYETRIDVGAKLESRQGFVSYVRDLMPGLSAQADLFWQRFDQDLSGSQVTKLTVANVAIPPTILAADIGASKTEWNPRFGIAWTPGSYGLRGAWQRSLKPVSTATLSPVATAGLAMEDRLTGAGGKLEQSTAQGFIELGRNNHLTLAYDDLEVRNLGQLGFRIPSPQIEFVDLLRNAQLANVNNGDLLEGTPDFDAGRLQSASIAFNSILSREWTLAARYAWTKNRATIFVLDDAGNIVNSGQDARVPFVPESLGTIGVTWVSPWRIYLSAMAVYRSERFSDRDNTQRLPADTTGTVAVFWETQDKRFILGASAGNLGSKTAKEAYVIDARYRF